MQRKDSKNKKIKNYFKRTLRKMVNKDITKAEAIENFQEVTRNVPMTLEKFYFISNLKISYPYIAAYLTQKIYKK